MESQMIFCIFGLRIRYENIKNLGSCLIASCLSANGYAFEVGPMFFMEHLPIEKAALNFGLTNRTWVLVKDADYPIYISDKIEFISFAKYPKGKLLKITFQHGFYPVINLRMNGEKNSRLVHRLVGNAFIPNPDNKPQINHKDGDKNNYQIDNLEWSTDQENKLHAHSTGLIKPSKNERSPLSKPIIQYTKQGEFVKEWPCGEEVLRQPEFKRSHIRHVASGKRKTASGFIWKFK